MIKSRFLQGIDCHHCAVRHACIAHDLPASDIHQLNELISTVINIPKKKHVYQACSNMLNIYALYSGSCKEYRIDRDGGEHVINFYFPGDIIGIESIPDKKYIYSVISLENAELCVIPINSFFKKMQKHPEILKRFLHINSLKMKNDTRIDTNSQSVEKLCYFILNIVTRMKKRAPHAEVFFLSMSQIDIGKFLGITYETVNRVLQNLNKKKIIKLKNKNLEIIDFYQLKKLCNLD